MVVPALVALVAVVGGACGSFGSASDPSGDGGTSPEGASGEAATGSSGATCPPSAGPSCALGKCSLRTLYAPDAAAYPFAIATDSAYVYWLEQRKVGADDDPYNGQGTARVLRTTRAGSNDAAGAEVLATGQQWATGLALVPPYVYWATYDGSRGGLSRVKAACTAPCTPERVVTDYSARFPRLSAGGTSALLALAENGRVVRFPIDASGTVGNGAVVVTTGDNPGMTVTGTHVYASGFQVDHVARATLDGVDSSNRWAPLSFPAGGDIGITNLATDCTALFGSRGPGGMLERVALDTGKVSLVATLNKDIYDVGADGKYLYVGAPNSGGILAVDTATNEVTQIADGSAFRIAVDSAGVYWGDHTKDVGGKLTMLVK